MKSFFGIPTLGPLSLSSTCTFTSVVNVVVGLCIYYNLYQHQQDQMEHYAKFCLLLHYTNVVAKTDLDFNTCDDYFNFVITCHVLAAPLKLLDMHSLSGSPSPVEIPNPHKQWLESKKCKKKTT